VLFLNLATVLICLLGNFLHLEECFLTVFKCPFLLHLWVCAVSVLGLTHIDGHRTHSGGGWFLWTWTCPGFPGSQNVYGGSGVLQTATGQRCHFCWYRDSHFP
jgi:hypothetical protein